MRLTGEGCKKSSGKGRISSRKPGACVVEEKLSQFQGMASEGRGAVSKEGDGQ